MKRVLVAEDEPAIAGLIAYTLESDGARVEVAPDGRAALDALAKFEPDVLVLDLLLPLASGWQILRHLRVSPVERRRALPVVVVSALASAKLRSELSGLGVGTVLGKPFALGELRRAVASAVAVTRASFSSDPPVTPTS